MRREDLQRYDYVSMDRLRASLKDAILLQLFDYWHARMTDGGKMSRNRLDPAEIHRLLPHVFIVEPVENGSRFRYRLVGTFIQSRINRRIEGLHVEDVRDEPVAGHLNTLFGTVARTGMPGLGVTTLSDDGGATTAYHRLVLPMTTGEGHVDQLLGGWALDHDSNMPPESQMLQSAEEPVSLTFVLPPDPG